MNIKFYTRNNCQLCDDGEIQLALALDYFEDIHVDKINIDTSDELQEKYMLEVPVVVHEDKVIQSGNIDFVTVYEYINNL